MSRRGSVRALCLALLFGAASGCALPIIGSAKYARNANEARASGGGPLGHAAHPVPNLSAARCYARLRDAGVAFEPIDPDEARGVREPLLLRGPIDGVEVVARDGDTLHSVLDCRLALALLAWAPALRAAGVDRLEHYSIYRPGARVAGKGSVSGHARGLAIDAARFHLAQGGTIDVRTDWEERDRGGAACPLRAGESAPSRLLRGLICDALARNLFQVVLTPHHDRAHDNHVHLELKPEVSWTYVR